MLTIDQSTFGQSTLLTVGEASMPAAHRASRHATDALDSVSVNLKSTQ